MSKVTVRRSLRNQTKTPRLTSDETSAIAVARVPRIAKLMALAICFDELVRDGVVADQAELARIGRVSRARITQIMNLLDLAPDIQEHILLIGQAGQAAIAERTLRPLSGISNWTAQRVAWSTIAGTFSVRS